MTKLDLDRLRQIANMATQGEWHIEKGVFVCHQPSYYGPESVIASTHDKDDAEHIATFNPQTVLALIELIEEAEVLLTTVPDGYYTEAWRKKAGFK